MVWISRVIYAFFPNWSSNTFGNTFGNILRNDSSLNIALSVKSNLDLCGWSRADTLFTNKRKKLIISYQKLFLLSRGLVQSHGNCLKAQREYREMSLKLRGRLARGRGSMLHYSPVMRDSFLRVMVTLLVTIPDLRTENRKEGGSQLTENI
jgi:hypothetical protein